MKINVYCFTEFSNNFVVVFLFNSISVILEQWKGNYDKLYAIKDHLDLDRISSLWGLEPKTIWPKVESTYL